MPEITIQQIAFGANGDPANLYNGIELPIDNETLDKTMMCMKVKYTATIGADGKAVFSNMIHGKYRTEEQSPPQYYLGTSVVYNISVYDGSNEPVSVTFENESSMWLLGFEICSQFVILHNNALQ